MQLKNVQRVLKEYDTVSHERDLTCFYCGDDEKNLITTYMDKDGKIIFEFDENNGKLITYVGYKNGYLFVINDASSSKNKSGAQLIKVDSDLRQTVLYETERITDAVDLDKGIIPRDASLGIMKDRCFGRIDLDGNEIIKPQYKRPFGFTLDGLAIVYNKGRFGIINKQGETIIPLKYDDIGYIFELLDDNGNSVRCIKAAKKSKIDKYYSVYNYGIINEKNEKIIPFEYNDILMCSRPSKFFAAKKDGLWGLVDINNNMVIPFEFDDIYKCESENKNLLYATKGSPFDVINYDVIDCNTLEVTHLEYVKIEQIYHYLKIAKKQNGKFVLLNSDNTAISDEYDEILFPLTIGNTLLRVKNGDKYGYINQQGKLIIPLKYNNAGDFESGLVVADNFVINENAEILYEADENQKIINLDVGIICVESKDEKEVYDLIKLI